MSFNSQEFARDWIRAWNSHDLDAILSHYSPTVVLTSPTAAKILNRPDGTVTAKEDLRGYFQRGLEAYPNLTFELLDVFTGLASIVLCYKNQTGGRTAEYMEFCADGKVTRVVANYHGG